MEFDLRLKTNFKLFLTGPSGCGKTVFISELLLNLESISQSPPKRVVYYYKTWQDKFEEMKNQKLVDEFIGDNANLLEQVKEMSESTFIIFDDLLNSTNLPSIAELYTVYGRHMGLSLAFISQKMFVNNEFFRQISQNSDYFVVFKNPRNFSEIRTLASQLTPSSLELIDIFKKATISPYSYLLINLTQECEPQLKYLGNLFKVDGVINSYVVNNY